MIEIFDCEQGSEEWFAARAGIPTASEFATVLAQGKKPGTSSIGRRKYMLQLIGEQLTGRIAEAYSNPHMERGKQLEPVARDLYALTSEPLRTVGFLRNGRVGASPDSLVGKEGLLEIKTKLPHLQLELILDGVFPSEHYAQCQGLLWVSKRQWLDFLSYWPGLPLYRHRVERDEEYIERLAQGVEAFLKEMDQICGQLKEMTFVEPTHYIKEFESLE